MSPVLTHLGLAAAVLAMVCALLLGVIPNLAQESPQSRPLHAWIDLWLPLLIALPLAAVVLTAQGRELSPTVLLCLLTAGPISLAATISGLALLNARGTSLAATIDTHHILACAVVATVLLAGAYVSRLPDWIGHLFLTSAILWLWTVSGDAHTDPQAGPHGDAVFFVDWTGPLAHPVRLAWRGVMAVAIILSIAFLILSSLGPEAPQAGPSLLGPLILAVVALAGQGAALLVVWHRVSPRAAIRASTSTMVLSVLLTIGLLCTRLVPWSALIRSRGRLDEVSYQTTDLTGLAVLGPAAVVVGLMASLGIAHRCSPAAARILGWSLIGAAIIAAAATGMLTRSSWPDLAPPDDTPPSAAPPQEESPSSRLPAIDRRGFALADSIHPINIDVLDHRRGA